MPANVKTNREERQARIEHNMQRMERTPEVIFPLSGSSDGFAYQARLLQHFTLDKVRLKAMTIYIADMNRLQAEVSVGFKSPQGNQENTFEIKKGLNRLPEEVQVPADTTIEVWVRGGEEFTATEVHFSCKMITVK